MGGKKRPSLKERIRYEYELQSLLEEMGYFVVRLPASGKKRHFDLLAFKDGKLFAIEVKSTTKSIKEALKGLSKEQRESLAKYEKEYGVRPIIAVRQIGLGKGGWKFFDLEGKEVKEFP